LGEILHIEGGWGLWVSFCELWGVLALFYFLIKNLGFIKMSCHFGGFQKTFYEVSQPREKRDIHCYKM